MATKKKIPEPDLLTSAAQAIGSTLGRLAVAAGIEHPAAPRVKKKTPAVKKKVLAKKVAPKKKSAAKKVQKAATKKGK
jgi:hypothetical protein